MTLPVHEVLKSYPVQAHTVSPILIGNINKTYRIDSNRGSFILQRVNPIFSPLIHHDIEVVTAYLESQNMLTPRLLRTRNGEFFTRDTEDHIWRMQTCIEGQTHSSAQTPALCEQAGRLVGRFHHIVSDLDYEMESTRTGVHDTQKHFANLEHALKQHKDHLAYDDVVKLAEGIFAMAKTLPPLPTVPLRIVHGDLKLNNILFADDGKALALVDWDTLGHMALPVELGDAFRSWCNPPGEEKAPAVFELAWFEAALKGYTSTAPDVLLREEQEQLVSATQTIAMELSARFAADALNESYFGWDANRYPSASAHHVQRAKSQFSLAQSIAAQRVQAETLVRRFF